MIDRFNAFVDRDPAPIGGDGPLAGVTVGVKANIAVGGLPWTAGMALHRDRIAIRDATVVTRLRAAGATVLGTLNMHEAALGATTDNPWFGRTLNPHDEGRTPGGSSGGSGAAVAGGLCDIALGTDTLGSVRIPAAYNGVYGLKPTNGALPDDGLEPMHRGFDAIGPLAKSLDLIERAWRVLSSDAGMGEGPARMLTLAGMGGVACEPAVLEGYRRALTLVGPTEEIALPPLGAVRMAAFVEAARALSAHLGADRHSDLLSADLRWLLDFADVATPDSALPVETRTALRTAIGEDGALILPTAPQAAFAHGVRAPANQADLTAIANIAGLPALALPAGRDGDGMPVGIQIIGPPGGEALLFAVARSLDRGLKN